MWFPDTVSAKKGKSDTVSQLLKRAVSVVPLYFLIPFSSFNKFLFSDFPMFIHVARPLYCQGLLQGFAGERCDTHLSTGCPEKGRLPNP